MYDDLIRRLRETESRSKRTLLDEAAQAIAELEQKFNALMEDTKKVIDDADSCDICAHVSTAKSCGIADISDCYLCLDEECVCKNCNGCDNWKWRGQMKEAMAYEDVMVCQKCGEPAPYSRFFGGYVCPCGCLTRLEPLQEVR